MRAQHLLHHTQLRVAPASLCIHRAKADTAILYSHPCAAVPPRLLPPTRCHADTRRDACGVWGATQRRRRPGSWSQWKPPDRARADCGVVRSLPQQEPSYGFSPQRVGEHTHNQHVRAPLWSCCFAFDCCCARARDEALDLTRAGGAGRAIASCLTTCSVVLCLRSLGG